MSRPTALLILLTLVGCGPRPVDSIRKDGNRYYGRGEYPEAAAEYNQIIERYPGDWKAQYWLGMCELQMHHPAEARRALEIAYTHKPDNPDVVDALAEAMYQMGDETRLYEFLSEIAEQSHSVSDYMRLSRYAMEMGDADSAVAAIETAIVVDDGRSVGPYLAAATYAEHLGDLDGAVRRLRQAYGIDPRDPRVQQRLRDLGEVPGPTIKLPAGK